MEDPVETSNGSSNSVSNRDSALEPVGGPIKTPNRAELGVPIGPQSDPQLGSNSRSGSALSASRLDGKRLTRIRWPN